MDKKLYYFSQNYLWSLVTPLDPRCLCSEFISSKHLPPNPLIAETLHHQWRCFNLLATYHKMVYSLYWDLWSGKSLCPDSKQTNQHPKVVPAQRDKWPAFGFIRLSHISTICQFMPPPYALYECKIQVIFWTWSTL